MLPSVLVFTQISRPLDVAHPHPPLSTCLAGALTLERSSCPSCLFPLMSRHQPPLQLPTLSSSSAPASNATSAAHLGIGAAPQCLQLSNQWSIVARLRWCCRSVFAPRRLNSHHRRPPSRTRAPYTATYHGFSHPHPDPNPPEPKKKLLLAWCGNKIWV